MAIASVCHWTLAPFAAHPRHRCRDNGGAVYTNRRLLQRRLEMDMTRRSFLTTAAVGTAAAAGNALALDKFGRDRDWTGEVTVTNVQSVNAMME